jgi:hypothetical protein
MKIIFLLLFFTFSAFSQNVRDLCDLMDLPNCSGVSKQGRRASSLSLPSPATSSLLNPANVSFDRGLGVEFIYQAGNPLVWNLATGAGKIGGALISSKIENAFFGNRVVEADEDYLERFEDNKQYKSKKLNLALGLKLFRSKNFALDAGVIGKRHDEIKDINLGAGFSGRLWLITFGGARYRDDFKLDLRNKVDLRTGIPYVITFGENEYEEKFDVTTYSVGTRLGNFALDYGRILTQYKFYDNEPSTVTLYSASYTWKNLLFNLAMRNETNPAMKYIDGKISTDESHNELYYGLQVSLGKHLIVGWSYNYFLLHENSFSATVYF